MEAARDPAAARGNGGAEAAVARVGRVGVDHGTWSSRCRFQLRIHWDATKLASQLTPESKHLRLNRKSCVSAVTKAILFHLRKNRIPNLLMKQLLQANLLAFGHLMRSAACRTYRGMFVCRVQK